MPAMAEIDMQTRPLCHRVFVETFQRRPYCVKPEKKLYVENEQNSVYLAIWINRRKDIRLSKTSQSGFWIEISERIWKL